MKKKVAVLYGGMSAEREVSLSSGKCVAEALNKDGKYEVVLIDVARDIAQRILEEKPDIAFNALHGKLGEDGSIQGILNILQIPYTHSGVLASAIAMDKPMAKKIFESVGIPTSQGLVVDKSDMLKSEPMKRPYVIKPLNEGSSVGVTIIQEGSNYNFSEDTWQFGKQVLVEKYIAGREVQAAVLNGRCLGAIEIKPLGTFYDYEAKYTDGKAVHLMPAPIDKEAYDKICEYAVMAHNSLGCRGVSRTDFRYDDSKSYKDGIFILETNTQPGMTPLSLTPEIAAHSGLSFIDLLNELIEAAKWDD